MGLKHGLYAKWFVAKHHLAISPFCRYTVTLHIKVTLFQ